MVMFQNTAIVKADITTFPTSTDFTLANLIDLLPGLDNVSQITLGDYFKFYVDITLEDGTVIKGNDPAYASNNTSIANLPGSSINVIYTVACALDSAFSQLEVIIQYSPPTGLQMVILLLTADPNDPNTVLCFRSGNN